MLVKTVRDTGRVDMDKVMKVDTAALETLAHSQLKEAGIEVDDLDMQQLF